MNDTQFLLANILDGVNWLVWSRTENGSRGISRPESIFDILENEDKNKIDGIVFDTPEAFDRERERLLKEVNDG